MRKILLLIALIIQIQIVMAKESIVHSHTIEAGGGISQTIGYAANLGYSIQIKPRLELGLGLSYYNGTIDKGQYIIPLSNITAGFTLSNILVSSRRRMLSLWGDVEVMAGYESINHGKKELPDGAVIRCESGFIYGLAPTLRLEIPLSRNLAINCKIRELILPQSQATILLSEIIIGIRIKIH